MTIAYVETLQFAQVNGRRFPFGDNRNGAVQHALNYQAQLERRRREMLGRDMSARENQLGYAIDGRVDDRSREDRQRAELWKPTLIAPPEREPGHAFDEWLGSHERAQMRGTVEDHERKLWNDLRQQYDDQQAAANEQAPTDNPMYLKTLEVAYKLYENVAWNTSLPMSTLERARQLLAQAKEPRGDIQTTKRMAAELRQEILDREAARKQAWHDRYERERLKDVPPDMDMELAIQDAKQELISADESLARANEAADQELRQIYKKHGMSFPGDEPSDTR